MIRSVRRGLPLALLLPLVLTGCGGEKADPEARAEASASSSRAAAPDAAPTGPLPDPAELQERARYLQIAIEHVYVTEVDGYHLAQQSVGVSGEDGFSSVYITDKGVQILLEVDRGTIAEADCAQRPVYQAEGQAVRCERDGDGWYRTAGGRHEYARAEDGHVVRVAAERAVERSTLRTAFKAAHAADERELDAVLPPPRDRGQPVERGDLPPVGDGAPDNSVGVGG
ncbi:hypothetical protein AB0M39_22490 [Streptomyces sp. NPDC051907]|uniref:hypothetical protein n=1 Tax=Streptomyces sp. NPDC051907 TaxID=3155284 RepID=UPI003441646A